MCASSSPPTGLVIKPASAEEDTTDLRQRTDQIRAALHRGWLPSCRGAWQDQQNPTVGGAR